MIVRYIDSPVCAFAGGSGKLTWGGGRCEAEACMTMEGEEMGVAIDWEERDADPMVPETFAGRDDIYTDDDDAVVVFALVESLNM